MTVSPVWDVDRMRPVVNEWDAAVRAELPAYSRLVPEAEERGSVLRAPATEDDIAAAEARLGVALPPSYRSFLSISNGADAGCLGAGHQERLFPASPDELRRAQDLRALDEVVPGLVTMWRDAMRDFIDRQQLPSADTPVDVFDFELGRAALLITLGGQDRIVGLVPFIGEWQVWEFWHSEVSAHQSFASLLEHKARQARERVAQRTERVRVAVADGSSPIELQDLAEHGDDRALDAACRALFDDRLTDEQKDRAALMLSYLGDPRAIPQLRLGLQHARARDRSTLPAHMTDERIQASRRGLEWFILRALDSCGDHEVVDELERVAAAGSPGLAGWAEQHLERRDQLPRW